MSGRNGVSAILFDKDGTIIDYWATWLPINREVALFAAGGDARLANDLLRAGGQDPVRNTVTAGTPLAAGSVEEIAAVFAAELRQRTPPRLVHEIDRIFQEGGARYSALIAGAAECVAEMERRGFLLGLATNDTAGGITASLAAHGLLPRFRFVAGCDSGYGPKPEPGMAMAFAGAVGVDPRDMAVVGDNAHDLEMGRRAGAGLLVGVLCGTGRAADLGATAHIMLETTADMMRHRHFERPGRRYARRDAPFESQ